MRKSPSSFPAQAPATITPSRPCSPRTRLSNTPASPSSLSAGARTSTTGSIPALWWPLPAFSWATWSGFLYPNFMSGSNPGPLFMALVAVVFSFFVAWIASKGAGASTAVNMAMNIVQISALVVFSVLALGYRANHPAGSPAFQYDGQTLATYSYQFATNPKDGSIMRDASGNPLPLLDKTGTPVPFTIDYPTTDSTGNFLSSSKCRVRDRTSQAELDVYSGNGRDSDSGRFRIGDLDGRRGQESHQTYTHRRDRIASDPRSDSVISSSISAPITSSIPGIPCKVRPTRPRPSAT